MSTYASRARRPPSAPPLTPGWLTVIGWPDGRQSHFPHPSEAAAEQHARRLREELTGRGLVGYRVFTSYRH